MAVPSNVDVKKSKVYIQKLSGEYLQIHPETFCESEILDDSLWPVSSHALKLYSDSIEERIAPFAGATSTRIGKIGTVPQAEIGDRNSFLRGDGRWAQVSITDDKVKCTFNKAKKFYLIGTEIADTNTGQATFDTGVFVSDQPGELHSTKFVGNLQGNVVGNLDGIAERAKRDENGNLIARTYATKELVEGTYSKLGHVHSTSEITSLDGYAKGSATAISGDDSLNQALGKLETRIDRAATMNSPSLTGVPTTPTPTAQSEANQIANKEYVDNRISDLVGGAGAALDTLQELAQSLGSDPDFAGSMTRKFDTKMDKTSPNYTKSLSISDNAAGSGQILKVQRGDDTSYTLQIKDTVYTPSDDEPKPSGTASPGTSAKYSRGDHVHPLQTTISGNAATATSAGQADKLTNARKLRTNLASTSEATFNGTADQLNIPVTGVLPVANGGTGAANLNGLVQTGAVNQTIAGTKTFSSTIAGSINGNAATATTATKTQATPAGTSWVAGATLGKALVNSSATSFGAVLNAPTKSYRVGLGTYPGSNELVYLYSVSNANVNAGTNTVNRQLTWNAADGTLTANAFSGTLNGSSTSCTGNAATASKLGTATVGSGTKPIYLNAGTATASGSTVGSASKPVYMNGGNIVACSSTVGSASKPVYMNGGNIAACSSTVGSASKPVYMNAGNIAACSSTVGSTTKPVYMNGGAITASNANVGSATKPMYLKSGVMTACTGGAKWVLAFTFNKPGNYSTMTITGCTVGIPILVAHTCAMAGGMSNKGAWTGVKVTSGAAIGTGQFYWFGAAMANNVWEDMRGSVWSALLVPTATKITLQTFENSDDDDKFLIYKME